MVAYCLILCLCVVPLSAAEEPVAPVAVLPQPTAPDGLIPSPEPDWPQWRGPRRDGILDEKGLLPAWPPEGPKLLRKIDGLGTGWSSPIIVGQQLFITGDVGDNLVIFAFDTKGTALWQAKNGPAWKKSYPGARACCVFSEGKIYHLNAHGRLACLDAASGTELWWLDILKEFEAQNIKWALSECLLVDGPRLIVTPGGKKALMAALDKHTGRTIWATTPLEEDTTSHCSPILFQYAGRRLITNCSSAHGFGVDADTGQLLWTVPLKNPYGTNVATPVYGSGCLYYVTPYAELGRAYRLQVKGRGITAEHLWTCPLDTVTGGAVLVDGTLYASGYRDCKWYLAVNWQTGQTKSECKDLTTGSAIYADNRLYCLDETGTAALLKPGADGLEFQGRFRLTAEKVHDAWAHPVLLHGILYLRYHDTLWCFDVKGGS